jgi:hypothetical protein
VGIGIARTLTRVAEPEPPRVTHEVVIQQIRSVAQLATAEATVRDVVTYEQTRYLATKRALLVVTGRVLAGVNLDPAASDGGAQVQLDAAARRIRVEIPPARVLAVEVADVRTYDERAGLLNPFRPEDRDAMQRQARERVRQAGADLRVLEHAERNAATALQALLGRDGWSVEVVVRGRAAVPAPTPAAPATPVPVAPRG